MMPTERRNVSWTLRRADGSIWPHGRVTFSCVGRADKSFTSDINGVGSLELVVDNKHQYTCFLPDGTSFSFPLLHGSEPLMLEHVYPQLAEPVNNLYLTLYQPVNGDVSVSPPGPYSVGTHVNLTATADDGYALDNWTLDGSDAGDDNPLVVVMDTGHSVAAAFAVDAPDFLVHDTFDRADGPIGTADSGQTWVVVSGDGTEAVIDAHHVRPNFYYVLADTGGGADDVDISITVVTVADPSVRLFARSTVDGPGGNHFWDMNIDGSQYSVLVKRLRASAGGSWLAQTGWVDSDPVLTIQAGDVVRWLLVDSTYTVFINDTQIGTGSFTPEDGVTYQPYGTYVGFTDSNDTNTYDDFTVTVPS